MIIGPATIMDVNLVFPLQPALLHPVHMQSGLNGAKLVPLQAIMAHTLTGQSQRCDWGWSCISPARCLVGYGRPAVQRITMGAITVNRFRP